uniref:Uncharacterized protein n=1 Tax=Anopheles albimanus TaxID=7167 RepID=A0A182F9S6_ANOAL
MKMGNRRLSTPQQPLRQLSTLPALIFAFILVCTALAAPPAIASYRVPIMRDGEGRLPATGDSGRSAARPPSPPPPAHRFVGGFIDDSLINRDDRRRRKPDDGTADRGCCDGTDVISTEATACPDHRRHTAVRQRQRGVQRTTGPVHTYIKTDKNGHFKWGVRHFVGSKYAR